MAVTIAAICDGIATTLATGAGINTVKSYDELTEGIPGVDCPRLQVYPEGFAPNPGSRTDRLTFQAAMQHQELIVFVDHYARKRSQMAQDMKAVVVSLDALIDVLEAQEKKPFFAVAAIDSFDWVWKRATLVYAGERYAGGRFTITLRIA